MPFATEPPYTHGFSPRTAILLVNLGTPDAPRPKELRRYLAQFLSDPRVVEIPRLLWWLLLKLVVLPLRSPRSAAKYALIWMKEGSPLRVYTERQAKLLRGALGARGQAVLVEWGMRYGAPSIATALDALKAAGAERILVLPLYPQYSATTTASSMDAIQAWCAKTRNVPELRFIKHYHDHPAYIGAWAKHIRMFWETNGHPARPATVAETKLQARLVMSFHGVPKRSLALGDPYHCECQVTARLLREALDLEPQFAPITFQSRFGRAEWLEPYTEPTLEALARQGVKDVDIVCPGFPADCLETLGEIALEGKAVFMGAGGQNYRFVPCLNDSPFWIEALAQIAAGHLAGWPTGALDQAASDGQRERALALGATN